MSVDREGMRREHVCHLDLCHHCGEAWPCKTVGLLDELDALTVPPIPKRVIYTKSASEGILAGTSVVRIKVECARMMDGCDCTKPDLDSFGDCCNLIEVWASR